MLCMMEVGSGIPTELYEVVAAIYCKLMETSEKIKSTEVISESKRRRARNGQQSSVRARLASKKKLEEKQEE